MKATEIAARVVRSACHSNPEANPCSGTLQKRAIAGHHIEIMLAANVRFALLTGPKKLDPLRTPQGVTDYSDHSALLTRN